MKVIEEFPIIESGVAKRVIYHLPRSTRQIDKVEYAGLEHSAYCGHSDRAAGLPEKDFSEYSDRRDMPEGMLICGECVTEFGERPVGDPWGAIFSGEIDDPRLITPDNG